MSMLPVLRAPTSDDPSSVQYPPAAQANPLPLPTQSPAANPAPPPLTDSSQYREDARAYMQSLLDQYGLGSLGDWAYQQLIAGHSPTVIMQMLQERAEFKARFPVIAARRAAGLAPMSVAEILAYEKQARQLFRSSGLPLGFYDSNSDMQDLMGKDVSLTELSSRIQLATQDYFNTDPLQRNELQRLYNLSPGQHLAFILDPDVALPLIEREFTAASLSATAQRTTYGGLSRDEAEQLAALGISSDQALRGFSTLAAQRGLFTPLPDEVATDISRSEQMSAAFYGDAQAQQRIKRRQEARLAPYQEGGGFAASSQGITGLSSPVT